MRRILAIFSAAALVACNRGDRADVDTALTKSVDAIGAVADSAAGRLAGREYSNAELAGFLHTYNAAEVEIGQMALTKATDPGVRAFAQRIITDHRALEAEVTKTSRELNVTPGIGGDIEDVTEDHQKGMQDLNAKAKGREFDEAFLEHEIRMHRKVLDEVEDSIGRNRNPELRPLLEKAQAGLKSHLTTAEELEKKFGT
jgi:putative membrane protein